MKEVVTGVAAVSGFPEWSEILGFVTGGGFAVFVAVWFLIRLDSRIEKFTAAVVALEKVVATMHRSLQDSRRIGDSGKGGVEDQ